MSIHQTRIRHLNRQSVRRLVWLFLGLTTGVVLAVGRACPACVETVYGNWLYPGIRGFFSYTLSLLPVPAIGILLLGLLWLFWYRALRPLIRGRVTAASALFGTASTLCALFSLFYLLWGFNYLRPGLAERNALSVAPLSETEIASEYQRALAELEAMINSVDTSQLGEATLTDVHKKSRTCQSALGPVVDEMGYSMAIPVRCRIIRPKGILLRLNTAGVFIPYAGEGHVDAGLLPVQLPYTMIHEMAHGYGITDEGECNFVAYLACRDADDELIRFSGLLGYWRYVAFEYRKMFPDRFEEDYELLSPFLRNTLRAIHENNRRYPDFLPRLRNKVYDTYLKSNGVREGLRSYSQVVMLVHAYFQSGRPSGSDPVD